MPLSVNEKRKEEKTLERKIALLKEKLQIAKSAASSSKLPQGNELEDESPSRPNSRKPPLPEQSPSPSARSFISTASEAPSELYAEDMRTGRSSVDTNREVDKLLLEVESAKATHDVEIAGVLSSTAGDQNSRAAKKANVNKLPPAVRVPSRTKVQVLRGLRHQFFHRRCPTVLTAQKKRCQDERMLHALSAARPLNQATPSLTRALSCGCVSNWRS